MSKSPDRRTSTFVSSKITEPAWFHGVWLIESTEEKVPQFNLLASSPNVSIKWLVQSITVGVGEVDDRQDAPVVTVQYKIVVPNEEDGKSGGPLAIEEVALGQARGVWGIQGNPDSVTPAPCFLFLNLEVPGGIDFRVAFVLEREEDEENGDVVHLRILKRNDEDAPVASTSTSTSSSSSSSSEPAKPTGLYSETGIEASFRKVAT